MIHINLNLAVAIFLLSINLTIFFIWITKKNQQQFALYDLQSLKQCKFCTHIFFLYKEPNVYICPRCKSYIQREGTNEKGAVLLIVLSIIFVMLILTINIISLNVSQVMVEETESKRLQEEALATGALTYTFFNQLGNNPADSKINYAKKPNNITFNVSSEIKTSQANPYQTDSLDIKVSY